MSNPFRYTIAVAAALLAVLVAAPACQCESKVPIATTEHDIALGWEDVKGKAGWKNIKPIRVRGGDTIRISVKDHTAWFLIPDDRFRLLEGGSDWVISKSFTAFKIENGSAVIRLNDCSSDSEPKDGMHYSVLVRHSNGQWEYVHGENPPPKMIVPPHQ